MFSPYQCNLLITDCPGDVGLACGIGVEDSGATPNGHGVGVGSWQALDSAWIEVDSAWIEVGSAWIEMGSAWITVDSAWIAVGSIS